MKISSKLFSIIVPPLIFLFACKSTQLSQTSFNDDLSMYRPAFFDSLIKFEDPYSLEYQKVAFEEPKNHITQMLEEKLNLLTQNANLKVTKMEGFRIQAYSGISREDAFKLREDFTKLFPDIKVEYQYRQPNHKIMIGNYLTKAEAYKFYSSIKDKFPNAIVIPELINFNRSDFIKK
jgi:hypothetical protein